MKQDVYVWNASWFRTIDDLSNVIGSRIAPTTQLKSQRPIWRHERATNNLGVLLNHLLGVGSKTLKFRRWFVELNQDWAWWLHLKHQCVISFWNAVNLVDDTCLSNDCWRGTLRGKIHHLHWPCKTDGRRTNSGHPIILNNFNYSF